MNAGKRIHSIGNGLLNQPQGVIFIPEFNRIYVSNGQDGSVDIFDAKSFSFVKKIKLSSGDDADNIHYDPTSKLVYVGYGEGALGIINAYNDSVVGNIQGSDLGEVKGWSLQTAQLMSDLSHDGAVLCVKFTPVKGHIIFQ